MKNMNMEKYEYSNSQTLRIFVRNTNIRMFEYSFPSLNISYMDVTRKVRINFKIMRAVSVKMQ